VGGGVRRARFRRPAAGLVALALVLVAWAGAARGADRSLDYFALGDSVASGRGLMDSGGACRRSPLAYPQQVRDLLARRYASVRFRFLACAGAEASASGKPGLLAFRRQVDAVLRTRTGRRALVSVTIGVNDTRWSDIALTYRRLRELDAGGFDAWARGVSARVERAVVRQLRRLLARPSVRVVLTEYFNPVNRGSILFGPPEPCVDVEACYRRTELVVDELNRALRRVPGDLRARRRVAVAPVRGAFRGHEAPSPECGGAPPEVGGTWIQYPSDPASNAFPALPPGVPGPWRGDCFHPNERGAAAIASAVVGAARRVGR
jgi:lysophospholipase L1-like esterase